MFVIAFAYRWQLPLCTWKAGSYHEIVVVFIKPRHMLSTDYSIETLCPGLINLDTFKAPAIGSYYLSSFISL